MAGVTSRRLICALLFVLVSLSLQAQKARIKLGTNAVLILERKLFSVAGKSLKFYEKKQPNTSNSLIAVNGRPVFGTDGELPKYVLQKAVLLLNGRRYDLRVNTMYNPWFGDDPKYGPNQESARLLKKGNMYCLQAVFSDGAGTYRAEWIVVGGIAKRTRLSADDEYVTNYYLNSEK